MTTPRPIRIVGLSGSLRRASFNTALLRAAAEAAPPGVSLSVETLHGIPLYDADLEAERGLPERVLALKGAITSADALLLATPEYNNSIPGVFKNAIDWLSRPDADNPDVFGGRIVALIGASAGGFGTLLSQNAWLSVLRMLKVHFWGGGRLLVPHAGQMISSDGEVTDEATRKKLAAFLGDFATFVRQTRGDAA